MIKYAILDVIFEHSYTQLAGLLSGITGYEWEHLGTLHSVNTVHHCIHK